MMPGWLLLCGILTGRILSGHSLQPEHDCPEVVTIAQTIETCPDQMNECDMAALCWHLTKAHERCPTPTPKTGKK
jgi:hypothetical protein